MQRYPPDVHPLIKSLVTNHYCQRHNFIVVKRIIFEGMARDMGRVSAAIRPPLTSVLVAVYLSACDTTARIPFWCVSRARKARVSLPQFPEDRGAISRWGLDSCWRRVIRATKGKFGPPSFLFPPVVSQCATSVCTISNIPPSVTAFARNVLSR